MSYEAQAKESGKTAVQIIELHMQRCSRSYGGAPCVAAIGVTGTDRCFNTTATCQDRDNLALVPFVYRFASQRIDDFYVTGVISAILTEADDPLLTEGDDELILEDAVEAVAEAPVYPTLLNVKTAPTILTPGKGLGVRSSLSVTIQDHPWTDVGCDPYRKLRAYNPDDQGTFWGRWLKRNSYYQNRRIDVLTGFMNGDGSYDEANFKRRSYIINKISGPSANGQVTIEAKDPLKLADGEKAKWPVAATATLTANINELVTSVQIVDTNLDLVDWWAAGQRYVRVEEEIMLATAESGIGTATVTLTVTRGSMPPFYQSSLNVAYPHDAGASVQPCWLFDNEKVYDIVYFLLNSVAGIDAVFLPLAEWTDEIENGFSYLTFSRLLTEPVSVKLMLEEISKLSVLMWWHERDQEVKLKGLRFRQLIGPQINDDNSIIAESVGVTEDSNALITQSWIFFDINSPFAQPDLLRNYRNVDVRANLDRETEEEYQRKAIREMRTWWLTRADAGTAVEIGTTTLRQYQDVRKVISWAMDPKDDAYWVGDTVGISTRYIQDASGLPDLGNYLITQAEEVVGDRGMILRYVATQLFAFVRTGVITHPNGAGGDPIPAPPDYSAASDAEKNQWAYICYNTPPEPNGPLFLDGTRAYQIT